MPIRVGYVAGTLDDGAFIAGYTYGSEGLLPPASASASASESDPGPPISGLSLHTFPVTSAGAIRAGYIQRGMFDDIYNRIHVNPTEIDFGNITPPQSRVVNIWNAFFTAQTLTDIVGVGVADGLEWSPAPPQVLLPLQSVELTLTAGPDVSPTVDVIFTLEWDGAPSISIHVTGVSIISAPWRHLVPMQETLSWLTDIMTSKDGSEQAASLRETPRQVYAVSVRPNDWTGAQHAFLSGYGRRFAVPSFDEGQPFSVDAGELEVLLDTSTGDWREMVMLRVSDDDFEIIEIDEVLSDRLVLKRATSAARTGRAYPTAAARLISDPVRTTFGRFSGRIAATFEFTHGRDLAGDPSAVQWDGHDVLLIPPKLHPVDDTMTQRIETQDNATGWPNDDRYWPHAKTARPMRWVVSRTEMWTLRRWLHRRRGQWRPFWHPSFERDFTIAGTSAINNALIVRANGFERYGVGRALALVTHAGEWVFADIAGVSTDGTNIALELVQSLSQTHEQIRRVSLMGLKRLADDTVQINHLGKGFHEVLAEFLDYGS